MPVRRARAAGPAADDTANLSGGAELRARILHASVALIEEEGLAKLSMREVARRAGVTHQAPYHHFADREAILGEIAEEGFRMLADCLEQADPKSGRTPEAMIERITAVGSAYVHFACRHPAHFRIMFRPELVDLENCPGAKAEGENAFTIVQRLIHEAVEAGIPAAPSEGAFFALYWSIGHGLACLLLDGPLAAKMPDVARDAQIAMVVDAMRAQLEASLRGAQAAADPRSSPPARARRRTPGRRRKSSA